MKPLNNKVTEIAYDCGISSRSILNNEMSMKPASQPWVQMVDSNLVKLTNLAME